MAYKQEWHRTTQNSVNTGFRIPNDLYDRFVRYLKATGKGKTDVLIAALDAYLPRYDEEGGSEE